MSRYKATNTTNSRSANLDALLLMTPVTPQSVDGPASYTQGGSVLQFEISNYSVNFGTSISLDIEEVHANLTGYSEFGTELFSNPTSPYAQVCAFYIESAQPTFTSPYNVSQYTSCTILMAGGGGGGGGGGGPSYDGPGQRTAGGAGGQGGDGGISIYKDVAIPNSVNTISFGVGNGGAAGNGGAVNNINSPAISPGNNGGSGNATFVTIGPATYIANGGGGGQKGTGGPRTSIAPGATGGDGTSGNINPSTPTGGTGVANFNASIIRENNGNSFLYNSVNRVITLAPGSGTNTSYVQGGSRGVAGQPAPSPLGAGNAGNAGNAGYCRIYFYK